MPSECYVVYSYISGECNIDVIYSLIYTFIYLFLVVNTFLCTSRAGFNFHQLSDFSFIWRNGAPRSRSRL